MALMTQAQAKKFIAMDDKMLDVLDYLKEKGVLDARMHRKILLEGYSKLVEYLEQKKYIKANEAKEAIKKGFDYLLPVLAE